MIYFSLLLLEKLYKEPAVSVPTFARLSEIANSLGFEMEESELMAYRGRNLGDELLVIIWCKLLSELINLISIIILSEAISSTLADTYQRLYELPDPKLPVKYPRTPGYRPSPEDNLYNAWKVKCQRNLLIQRKP